MTGGRAVVLGETGRNFGAGMSGGIAYVWDHDDLFHRNLNNEMVDLDPLDDTDEAWLRDTIRTHLAEPDSALAQPILDRWLPSNRPYKNVMPVDSKRIIEAAQNARVAHRDL